MSTMGRYCKAYPIQQFEQYDGWIHKARTPKTEASDDSDTAPPRYYFLHENYTVTSGIFLDEDIIFDDVTESWIAFCEKNLAFTVPDYVLESVAAPAT